MRCRKVGLNAPAAAREDGGAAGALSFGFVDVSKDTVNLHKTVRVRNYSPTTTSNTARWE